MTRAGLLLVILLLATAQPRDTGLARQTEGAGTQLVRNCRLYFEFLGRTGAGREEAFDQSPFGMGYCAGLVRGVTDVARTRMEDRLCIPEVTTEAEAVWVVVRYLENNQIAQPERDTDLVLRALENTYRCR